MAKILLISANTYTNPYPVYPIGVATIAAALKSKDHEVLIHDCLFPGEGLEAKLNSWQPDAIGISIRNLDSVDSLDPEYWDGEAAKKLVETIKRQSSAKIFLGGAGFTVMPEKLLDYSGADYGLLGPSEDSVVQLIDDIINRRPSPRLLASPGFNTHLRPYIDRSLLDQYQGAGGIIGVLTKRGCKHRCIYCTYPQVDGKFFKQLEVAEVVRHIKELEEVGVEEIFFTDSVFNDASGHAVALAKEMLKQKTKVRFAAYFTPARTERSELELFCKAGLFAVELGTDATTDQTLRGLGKSFNFAKVREFQKDCVEMKLPCAHFVIFGGPNETMESIEEGLENLESLDHCVVMAFSGVRLHPNTALERLALRQGIIKEGMDLFKPTYYFSRDVDVQEMNRRVEEKFSKRFDRIFPPKRGRELMQTMRQLGRKGLLWHSTIRFNK